MQATRKSARCCLACVDGSKPLTRRVCASLTASARKRGATRPRAVSGAQRAGVSWRSAWQTALVMTCGHGVRMFILDRHSGDFLEVADAPKVPATSNEYAINASNYRHWPRPIRAFIDDCVDGTEGPRGRDFNMRWVASLVAETHRILSRGGLFLYPGDDREGYARGRLRIIYECAPIAFLIEQAGGKATDSVDPILDQQATELHGRTPFVFGSANKVDKVTTYYDLPENETSALFGKRGLFRG